MNYICSIYPTAWPPARILFAPAVPPHLPPLRKQSNLFYYFDESSTDARRQTLWPGQEFALTYNFPPPRRGGVNPPDLSTASAHPPPLPRDGALTPDHRKRPTASTTAASVFTTVAGRNTTPLTRATVAPLATPPSQNTFVLFDAADESHALAVGTVAAGSVFDTAEDNDVDPTEGTAREDGNSQPLLDLDAMLAHDTITDPIIDTLNAHDRVLTSTIAGVDEADRALDLAITGVTTTLDDDDDDVTAATTMASLMPTVPHGNVTKAPTLATMMLMLRTMLSQNQAILNRLDAMDDTSNRRHGRLRTAINSKADSTKIARLDHQLEVMVHTIRDDVSNTIGGQLTSAMTSIVDLKANLSHVTKTHTAHLECLENMLVSQHTCLDSYSTTYDDRFAALEQRLSPPTKTPHTTVVDPGPDSANVADDVVDFVGTIPPPHAPHRPVHNNSPQATSRRSIDPTRVLPDNSTFTLPSGHFGSGLGGPTVNIATTPRDEQGANAHVAHMAGPADAHFRAASSITPSRPVTRPPHITPPPYTPPTYAADPTVVRPLSPCTGGKLLTPQEHQERTKGVNRFNIDGLPHPPYHGKTHGIDPLTMGFLANCGYNMVSSDDVVGSLNDIVTVHRQISDTWTNPSTNTSGPQADRILLKSFKLFPTLKSLATEDVVGFYDRFQELSTSHLLALMPFDSIVLKNRYEGLFIPGLGTRRYAECARAMMDFLPRLIPGTLSTCMDATLAAVRYESNNGNDYLWRVLKLYVPGFDPIVPIHPPQWADSNDVFHFAQAYLRFFRLQGKMLYHYTDRTRSGIFLRAILHSDYADTVTLLQSQVNSYREEYDTGFLPPHLRVHGLAESIHQNAQSRMRDIASPRIR